MIRIYRATASLALALIAVSATAQTTDPGAGVTSTTAQPRTHHRRHHRQTKVEATAPGATVNGTGAGGSRALETPAQRAADQRLLQQQQVQSSHAAKVNNQIVQQANQQQQQQQNEVRIQDAPGPAQTGVVPGAGVPVAPVNADDRIQDAPGPAQTLPRLPATYPSAAQQGTQPAMQPAMQQPAMQQPTDNTATPQGGTQPATNAAPDNTQPNPSVPQR